MIRSLIVVLFVGCSVIGCVGPHSPQAASQEESTASAPSVCGVWQSVSSDKVYVFRCRGRGAFDVLQVVDGTTLVIGSGMQLDASITATVHIPKGDQVRRSLLELRFDGEDLIGTFTGSERTEHGNLRFIRRR